LDVHAAPVTRQIETTRTQRRCINRSCGRYRTKVEHPRCHSCGRSTKWAPTAFLSIIARKFR
jgi:hypothetical protein